MKIRLSIVIFFMLPGIMLLGGCSSKSSSSLPIETSVSEDSSLEEITTTEKTTVTDVTEKPKAELVLPLTENTSGKVQIQTVSANTVYPFNSYIITSASGETVVVDPTMMPSKKIVDLNPALIINTHDHPDHISDTFSKSYDCPKISSEVGDINTKDFHIYTIESSHMGDEILESNKNFMAVFEVDGLRIAHMGDIGQTSITDEQLESLGKIDIAFMQFENIYSDMTLENEKGFKLIEQLNPKIIIPTHYTNKAFPVIEEKYGEITEFENVLQISAEDLPEKSMTFYHITNTHKYK